MGGTGENEGRGRPETDVHSLFCAINYLKERCFPDKKKTLRRLSSDLQEAHQGASGVVVRLEDAAEKWISNDAQISTGPKATLCMMYDDHSRDAKLEKNRKTIDESIELFTEKQEDIKPNEDFSGCVFSFKRTHGRSALLRRRCKSTSPMICWT